MSAQLTVQICNFCEKHGVDRPCDNSSYQLQGEWEMRIQHGLDGHTPYYHEYHKHTHKRNKVMLHLEMTQKVKFDLWWLLTNVLISNAWLRAHKKKITCSLVQASGLRFRTNETFEICNKFVLLLPYPMLCWMGRDFDYFCDLKNWLFVFPQESIC